MKAVILAAAASERLQPFTETRAKPMIRVAGRPILEYLAEALKAAGVRDLLVVVNHRRETISAVFEHGHAYGLNIEYVYQEVIDGIGGALRRCEKLLGEEPFLLVYGDILTTGAPIVTVMQRFVESGGAVAALSLPAQSREFGNVYLNETMQIVRLVEKPKNPHLSNYVFAGIYVLPPSIFSLLERHQNDIERCYQELIQGGRLYGALWEGGWIDVIRPWHILEANRLVMDQWSRAEIHASVRLQGHVHIEGPVHIEENVEIGSGTVLKGPCFIGRDSYVGNNTLIRQHTALGPESVVGYGTELKNCVLFGKSVLGRLSYIGDSVIGERVHLGTGMTTVNHRLDHGEISVQTPEGAVGSGRTKLGGFIGDDVVIGARRVMGPGTTVRAGTQIDDLISVPPVV
jgi:bifunctional UDP-N-acetylglucosamine pyrophosphorylase/glucosamine-1-phosphate N-acetyltransferase